MATMDRGDQDNSHEAVPEGHTGPDPMMPPLGRDARVSAGRATSDPSGTGASHPAKPDPVSMRPQDAGTPPSDASVIDAVKQASAGDNGSLSPIPATFAHLAEDHGSGPGRNVAEGATAWNTPSDTFATKASDAVKAVHEQHVDEYPAEDSNSQQDRPAPAGKTEAASSPQTAPHQEPAAVGKADNMLFRPWLWIVGLLGLGLLISSRRQSAGSK